MRTEGEAAANARMKIDLHMHTTVSDGTDRPEEMIGRIREAGIRLFSVTDHDSAKACGIIRSLLEKEDPQSDVAFLIEGVEFSCRDEEGKYHILGYGFEPDAEPIRQVLDSGHRRRVRRTLRRIELLCEEYGYEFSGEEMDWLLSQENPGKPHIAQLMVARGWADSVRDAFDGCLDKLNCPSEYLSPEEAIACILESGGIPVLAHPIFGSGGQYIRGEDLERRVKRLTEIGLKGLEAYYSGFSAELREEVLSLAARHGLYVTAGSDYHGRTKDIPLGRTGLDDPADAPEGLKRFLCDILSGKRRQPSAEN